MTFLRVQSCSRLPNGASNARNRTLRAPAVHLPRAPDAAADLQISLGITLGSLHKSPSCLPRLPASWKHMVACASRSSVRPSWQTDPSCKCWMDGLGVTDEDRDWSWPREPPKGQLTCCIQAEPGLYSARILLRCGECAAAEPATQECGYPQCRSKTVECEREVNEACIIKA
jgi:hypothetical protein